MVMKKMIKKLSKILGGLLIAALMLNSVPLTGTAHAAAVTISISGITNHSGPALSSGAYVQVIQSSNASIGAPDGSGLPSGDIVVTTGTINPAGTFSGATSIPSSQYIAIRAWETWDGVGSPPAGTYYGTAVAENVGTGFVYVYDAAGFATSSQTNVPAPTITRSPSSFPLSITEGDSQAAQTFDVGNSGDATLNYTLSESSTWFSLDSSGGSIASGGGDDTITITFSTASLTPGTYNENITITDPAATNNPRTIAVNLTVNAIPTLNITTSSLADGTEGVAYSRTVSATGGTTPYTWSLASGTLPAGLNLNASSGVISGTPTGTGLSSFTVQVDDSGAQTDTQSLSITINPDGTATVTGIAPDNADQGETLDVTISGTNTTWSGITPSDVSFSGTGITVNTASETSATSIDANITITADATADARDVTVTGASGSATFTVNLGGGGGPTIDDITGISGSAAYPGQTIIISGSDFGADIGSSTVTVGGITAQLTAWSDTQITASIPDGVTAGSANVVVTTTGGSNSDSITIATTGAVLDDYEGGSVGAWPATIEGFADTGYYTFGTGVTPDNSTISADGPQATASAHGSRGMQIQYSYVSDWGGGWGASMANTLDLSAFDNFSFYVAWDGSTNDITLSIKDADGTAFAATVSNATLSSLTGYARVTLFTSAFSHDVDGSDGGADATMDWSAVNSYSIVYRSTGTSTTYHSIDSLVAGDVDLGGGGDDPVTEILITDIDPDAGPAGTKFVANGEGFGNTQGQSILVFENTTSGINYDVQVLAWSDTSIEAIVPRLAPAGSYQLKVLKLAISQGTMTAQESNAETFQVTANAPAPGIAMVFPNPFNPLETSVPATRASGLPANAATIAYDATGATNIGIYIYSSTAQLVFHEVTNDATQVTWNGCDFKGNHVADGVYLLRVVNEESKATIAKAKILVIKR